MKGWALSLSFIVAVYYIISIAAAQPERILAAISNCILNARCNSYWFLESTLYN